jgi:hypothetical protein
MKYHTLDSKCCWSCRLLVWGWRSPRTFAEYMATPAKRPQRDAMIAMCDEMLSRKGRTTHDV